MAVDAGGAGGAGNSGITTFCISAKLASGPTVRRVEEELELELGARGVDAERVLTEKKEAGKSVPELETGARCWTCYRACPDCASPRVLSLFDFETFSSTIT